MTGTLFSFLFRFLLSDTSIYRFLLSNCRQSCCTEVVFANDEKRKAPRYPVNPFVCMKSAKRIWIQGSCLSNTKMCQLSIMQVPPRALAYWTNDANSDNMFPGLGVQGFSKRTWSLTPRTSSLSCRSPTPMHRYPQSVPGLPGRPNI